MMKLLSILSLNTFFVFLSIMTYGQEDKKVSAKIESTTLENQIRIKAVVVNNTAVYKELNYLLISIKKGNGGNLSNNQQSGKFSVNPNQVKILSEISVNLEPKDALKAFLYIRDEESKALVAKDSLELNSDLFKKKTAKAEDDAVYELKGLTIDETKTKVGKDFYDMFYIQYSQLPDKSSSAVTISELPLRGTSGQINIQMDDKIIYSFITNPGEDYLKEQLASSLKYIKEFTAKKNLIKNEFIY
ncbi:curli production assembly/transport protein CsgE [Chryseobacterium jejuense]|uniref:Curli production assembly/transport component CsgE n=1 Tax=Chryseobacterium jejuense TaxID=445960 RepID=A0A2X2WPS6_CHRJE|nr:curli production assembly/transport protein CsgE [Chryseobacterium jejuense]SDJ67807.1 Curli assembly protein CsgE [Chryseobacterium jejuense]SQB43056.1 curli assembly protein CsgE [Chryseobacterium jejuense]